MNKVLIVAATEFEIAPFLSQLRLTGQAGPGLRNYRCGETALDVLVTGVGMTATAYCLGKTLGPAYRFALNVGLAGSFNRNLPVGAVVHVYADRFSELGAEDGDDFIPADEMNLGLVSEITNAALSGNEALDVLPKVNGITVNTVHGNEASIERVFRRFHPVTESMEGAAFLMACQAGGIPCAQIRAISNYVERRNRNAWNIPLAVQNLNQTLFSIIRSFS